MPTSYVSVVRVNTDVELATVYIRDLNVFTKLAELSDKNRAHLNLLLLKVQFV